jgi:hypothetical protein
MLTQFRMMTIAVAAVMALSAPDAFAQNTNANAQANAKIKKGNAFTVLPTVITSVTFDAVTGVLTANGLVGSQPFSAPLTMSAVPLPTDGLSAAAACPILNLELGPINLNLLGLQVETSQICLDVTANSGQGLLGDLLCGIANLLSNGALLSTVLGGLSPADLARLDSGLTQLLNQSVFIPISQSSALQGASCNVLNLALGPLDLNLLGLRVELDDCANGPVTVDVRAVPGAGLLGDLLSGLLCNLGGLFNGSLTPPVLAILRNIADLIGSILALGVA